MGSRTIALRLTNEISAYKARLVIGSQLCAVDMLNSLEDFAAVSDTKAIGALVCDASGPGYGDLECALTTLPPFPVTA